MSIPTYDPTHECQEDSLCHECTDPLCEACAAKWDVDGDCDQDGPYTYVKAQCVRCFWEEMGPRLFAALQRLVVRCDGDEGVRADGSNIDTVAAHYLLRKIERD